MVNLEKYGFVLKNDFCDSFIYELEGSSLFVHLGEERYTFYSIIDDCCINHVYMIRLKTDKDFEFIVENVRDIEFVFKDHSLT